MASAPSPGVRDRLLLPNVWSLALAGGEVPFDRVGTPLEGAPPFVALLQGVDLN